MALKKPWVPQSLSPTPLGTLDVSKIPCIPDQASKTQPNLLLLEVSQLTNYGLQLVGVVLIFWWLVVRMVFIFFN